MTETFTVVIVGVSKDGREAYFRRFRQKYGIDIFPAIEGVKTGMKMEITWDRPSFVPDFSLCGHPYGPIKGARLVREG